ncbi:hypothetical protein HUG17_9137 [Dermatophagoides farinae]|uniref:Uncharacterized protein n=1 Tax=Dermatophagoides farinae TaxID=6954 RepID=A0A9D4SDI2_DERFA|nr:hypothetical protein HUG17_9137 [Dermatophagoides farinae]
MTSILNIIMRNLNFSFIRRNYNVSIIEMLSDDFILLKFYSFRMHFLLADYRDHRIKKTYETFRPSIWITIHTWTFILLITSRLRNLSSSLLQYHANVSQYIVKRIFWNQFHFEYIILYGKISRLNESAKVILLAMEMIAKSAIMISCVFYSQQIKMVEANTFLVTIFIIVFLYVNIMYLRIAILPTYNEQCLRSILRWLIRSQWRHKFSDVQQNKQSTFYARIVQRIRWRQTLKSNLFIQATVNNRLGFTCGHMFHINKFKFTELIMLNIPYILMLYKHVTR